MKTWSIELYELPDGRIGVAGLPADRTERQSVVTRVLDTFRAIQHHDDIERLGSGKLWCRFAKESFHQGWSKEVTVELVEVQRELVD